MSPRATLETLTRTPSWGSVVLVCSVVAAVSWAGFYATDRGRLALVDQWERTAFALGQTVDDVGYGQLHQWSRSGVWYAVGRALVLYPGLALGAGLLLRVWTGRRGATERPTMRQCLAVAAHAGVILAVRDAVAAPLAYARETTASATTVGQWFPLLDETSPVARLLGALDLFVLWWLVVLAIGASTLTGRATRRWAMPLVGGYVALAVAVAAALAALNRG